MAMEKDVAKATYELAGLPIPQGVTIEQDTRPSKDELDNMVKEFGLPLFVKPATNGSSFGISRVTRAEDLATAIDVAAQKGGRVLVEAAVVGTEITVPVLGNAQPQALPIIEVITGADFYDEKVKYEPSELHHRIPASIPSRSYELAQEYAVRAHRALGCRGCSRSDFIVRDDGVPVILETNTIPGMTSASLLPDSARHAGIEFPELCKRFVELALEDKR
jgi:D-alanine-D-alanine ligase